MSNTTDYARNLAMDPTAWWFRPRLARIRAGHGALQALRTANVQALLRIAGRAAPGQVRPVRNGQHQRHRLPRAWLPQSRLTMGCRR